MMRWSDKLSVLLKPVKGEMPFMIAFMALMGIKWTRMLRLLVIHHNPDLTAFDLTGQLAFLFLMAYMGATLIHVVNRKWFRILAYALTIALFGTEMFLEKNFSMTISPSTLILLAETNGREVRNFFSMYLFTPASIKTYCWVAVAVAAVWLLERWYRKKTVAAVDRFFAKCRWLALLLIPWLALGVYSGKSLVNMLATDRTDEFYIDYQWQDVHPEDPVSELIRGIYGTHLARKEMQRAVQTTVNMRRDASVSFSDSVKVVLVIGESFSKWHSPLYGYPLNTTPCMVQERDSNRLVVFGDVMAPFNQTSPVIKNMLCCNSLAHGEAWYDKPCFPAIMRQAGYRVLFWDNQKDVGQGPITSFALNSFVYNPQMMEMCYDEGNDTLFKYDGMLIDDFVERHPKPAGRQFIMLHLFGQHFNADDMFPHEKQFLHFTADSIQRKEKFITPYKRQRIAIYDNATYYNDYNMGRLFQYLKNENAVLLYISDHGEEVFDYRDFEGRDAPNDHAEGDRLKYQFCVPCFIWCSDKYQQAHPDIVNLIRQATQQPLLSDNICHIIFHIAGVSTSYYNPQRDILNPAFQPAPRIGVAKY